MSQAPTKVLITYRPGPDATSQAELNTLAAIYRLVLFNSRSASKKAAEPAQPGTGEDEKHAIRRREADMT